ncbi:MAG TPA: tRNA (adenosine(37)-N6)-threonylcarbamoyltransferase complex dimerization subunit type 1 TsaB [Acetobacteraceae bacterium]|jgi:tRNA threonylcarbamoyladenosine biosynthesis protein TsaB|nr:tRNA (adenosine(37)-N6)-threonylcarbamoyltransferase complex dimerization subunit type 1 TsaB [Acetobacteraceae bacterium]
MRILALDSALARVSAAVTEDGQVLGAAAGEQSGALARLAEQALAAAGLAGRDLNAVAATVGPGSFTGIRAGLALASGLALACGIPVVGVSVGEAIAALLPDVPPARLWVAIDSRRGRIFLERTGQVTSWALPALPRPEGPVVLAGDAAEIAQAALTVLGGVVQRAEIQVSDATGVARAAVRRLAGHLPPRPASPLYVDPPAAKRAEGLRPPPQ